tara:strand:- start:1716 stop:2255 length:540 start_codon:yes stop_codon:yes gene_type:complete
MAESFVNSVTRAVGVVTSSLAGSVGVQTNLITGITTTNVTVGDIVDNTNFIAGTKVSSIGVNSTTCDRDSTNTVAASSQQVKYLGLTTAYTSASGVKSIIIGGTFANNTNSEVELTVHLYDNSGDVTPAIVSKVPVPNGSSFVLSDAGKTVLESLDAIRVYCDSNNALDVSLGILKGVN